MLHLDHIVNEILRIRDSLKENHQYRNSPLKIQLEINQGTIVEPVTRDQQERLIEVGPGNAFLPLIGKQLKMERLLNKIKHRSHDFSNFRIESNTQHFFIISVDQFKNHRASIIEFSVGNFCSHCLTIANLI